MCSGCVWGSKTLLHDLSLSLQNVTKPVQMMYQSDTFKMTYIKEIFTQILVLPYVGQELSMIIMLPDEDRDLKMVKMQGQWLWWPHCWQGPWLAPPL